MKPTLRFREDGTFTIVQFTDIHWTEGLEPDQMSRALMVDVLRRESPDLVVFTGDLVYSPDCKNPTASILATVEAVVRHGVPFAVVFGNHDSEAGVTREALLTALMTSDLCLADPGPVDVAGVGNYVLSVAGEDDEPGFLLYFLDSGSYAPEHIGGYDWLKHSQIEWYIQQSNHAAHFAKRPIPSLAFFHIPLPEYVSAWEMSRSVGHQYEKVCCPKLNSGFFAAAAQVGDIRGIFVGHDHVNDSRSSYFGIDLCYGRATGYNTYGREGFARGARVIRLIAGSGDFETWLRLSDGTVDAQQAPHARD